MGDAEGVLKQAVLWKMCKWLISACVDDIVERWITGVGHFWDFKKGYHSRMLPTLYKLCIFYVEFLNTSTL